MKIVVMCGGLSMERDVSIASSTLICRALRAMGHQAVLVDMFFGLEDAETPVERLFEELPELKDARVAEEAPDLDKVRASRKWKSRSSVGRGVFELCQAADMVFLGLHGACGEDGRIQAALDLMGIPYTGSGYLGSAIAMDKDLTKRLCAAEGILTPAWRMVYYDRDDLDALIGETELPCVVKPVDSGSSIGVAIARTREELRAALEANRSYGRAIVEQYIKGTEIDVGVLDGVALPSIQIVPKQGFYDYKNKYQAGAAIETCPSPVAPEVEEKLRAIALRAHNTLGLKSYSRSDLKLDEKGDIYFLEINTLPGMTPTSLMPQEAAAAGIDFNELCRRVIAGAMGGRA